MLSIRTGWPRAEILALTIREAGWTLDELDRAADQVSIRLAEAMHNADGLRKRLTAASGEVQEGNFAGLASFLASTGQLKPEQAEAVRLKQAAVDFIKRRESQRPGHV